MTPKKRCRLVLSKLRLISAVDTPAQETATAAIIKRAGDHDEFSALVQVAKVDDELGIVMGWCLTCTIDGKPYFDLQGDAISESELVKVAAEYMADGGHSDEMHEREPNGRALFLWPLTSEIAKALGITCSKTGLLVGIKPSREVLAKFKSGAYTGFSIDGMGERDPVEKRSMVDLAKQATDALTTFEVACAKFNAANKLPADSVIAFIKTEDGARLAADYHHAHAHHGYVSRFGDEP